MGKHPESGIAGPSESDLQGYGTSYVPRAYPGDGQLHTRRPAGVAVADIEQAPMKYIALALVHLHEQLGTAAKLLEDKSKPVDEYRVQTLVPDAESTMTILPAYEIPEVIQSVIISGPPAAVVTLQLGDRIFPIVIPATGFAVMGPVAFRLGRNDTRTLTAVVAGDYNVELMGYADNRW
jgi:hypothetical protein